MSPVPWPRTYDSYVTADVTLPTTTETVVATVGPISVDGADRRVQLTGWAVVDTAGSGATALTLRVRRGATVASPLVGEASAAQLYTATAQEEHGVDVQDAPGDVPSLVYALTVQLTGATGNGNVVQAKLRAVVLP